MPHPIASRTHSCVAIRLRTTRAADLLRGTCRACRKKPARQDYVLWFLVAVVQWFLCAMLARPAASAQTKARWREEHRGNRVGSSTPEEVVLTGGTIITTAARVVERQGASGPSTSWCLNVRCTKPDRSGAFWYRRVRKWAPTRTPTISFSFGAVARREHTRTLTVLALGSLTTTQRDCLFAWPT